LHFLLEFSIPIFFSTLLIIKFLFYSTGHTQTPTDAQQRAHKLNHASPLVLPDPKPRSSQNQRLVRVKPGRVLLAEQKTRRRAQQHLQPETLRHHVERIEHDQNNLIDLNRPPAQKIQRRLRVDSAREKPVPRPHAKRVYKTTRDQRTHAFESNRNGEAKTQFDERVRQQSQPSHRPVLAQKPTHNALL